MGGGSRSDVAPGIGVKSLVKANKLTLNTRSLASGEKMKRMQTHNGRMMVFNLPT